MVPGPGAGTGPGDTERDGRGVLGAAAEVAAGPGAVGRAGVPVGAAAVVGVDLADDGVAAVGEAGGVGRADRDLARGAARGRPVGVGDGGPVARVEEAGRPALGQRL